MSNTILATIESFPPLNESIQKINELCRVEEIDLKAFIGVIEADPLLYTSILKYVNVPEYGFRYPITSISQAIALFGISAIRGMSLRAALKAHPFSDVSVYGITVNEWFEVMERQQRFLDLWLRKKHRDFLQALGGLTFVLEIGRLLVSYFLDSMKKMYRFCNFDPSELMKEEIEIIGHSGDELASQLFAYWYFDPLFITGMQYAMMPDECSDPQICAALKCARTVFALDETKPFEIIEPILKEYGFDLEDARIAYEIVANQSSNEN